MRHNEASGRAYISHIFLVVVIVLGSLAYLWGHVESLRQREDLARLSVEREALLRRQEGLNAKIAGLTLSTRIGRIASDKLGMGYPSEAPRNLYLKASKPTASSGEDVHAH
jgi:cell division protein FtsL